MTMHQKMIDEGGQFSTLLVSKIKAWKSIVFLSFSEDVLFPEVQKRISQLEHSLKLDIVDGSLTKSFVKVGGLKRIRLRAGKGAAGVHASEIAEM